MTFKKGDYFSEQFIVSSEIHERFIDLFKDKNPLHTDESFAIANKFESRVMHGNILNGFISYFVGECLPSKNIIIHSQDIVYKKPVYLNDRLRLNVTVENIYESVHAVEFKFEFINTGLKLVAKGKFQIGLLV